MNKKLFYTAPASRVFEVACERALLDTSNTGGANEPGTVGDEDPDHTYSF